MPNLIISTCGTSLLTNRADPKMRRLLVHHANAKGQDIGEDVRKIIDKWIEQRRQDLVDMKEDDAAKMSAEINGLTAYYRAAGAAIRGAKQDQHHLVVTDTYLGQQAFECISEWLKGRCGQVPQKITAGGLNTSDIADFRAALADIVWKLEQMDLPNWRNQGYHIAFNLTGGFKSVNGFMQSLGMLLADECFYLFEGGKEIMRVPRLPINLDSEGALGTNLMAVRRMAKGYELNRADCGTLPDTLLFVASNDEITLSEWGTALWAAERPGFYKGKLMEPLSDRLKFSVGFERQVTGQERGLNDRTRLNTLNQRLDDLARYIDNNHDHNPLSLDFKRISGRPVDGNTHEFDIWGDRSDRGFGHYEGNIFIVDRIGDHL